MISCGAIHDQPTGFPKTGCTRYWSVGPSSAALPEFPQSDRLGRIAVGKMDVFARPDGSGQPIGALYEDQVVPWVHEVVGSIPGRTNQHFVQTPGGYDGEVTSSPSGTN